MEGEITEVAVASNKDEKFEKMLSALNLTNYPLGKLIRSNSMINLVHVKGKRVLTSDKNNLHIHMDIQRVECVNSKGKRVNNWSYEEDWSFTLRKDQDYSGSVPMRNNDLTNIIHVSTHEALYFDDVKKSTDGKTMLVGCRTFNEDLMLFQWYVNFVYSPYNDDFLRSGTIIKLNTGCGNLHSITDPSTFSQQHVCLNAGTAVEEGNYAEDEDNYWLVLIKQ